MLTILQTALNFILILGVLVFFHELGHFGVAKFFKMRVEEFAFGFGKRLFRVAFDGQTEYTVRALPLGGFVRIAGMEIEDGVESRLTGGRRSEPGMETTNTALLEQEAAEEDGVVPDGYNSRPVYQRFLVILAGPVFSFLLGWLVLCLMGVTFGLPVGPITNQIAAVVAGGAAERAGIKAQERITVVDGQPITNGEALVQTIRGAAGRPLRLTVQDAAGEKERTVVVTPRPEVIGGKRVGLIGIRPGSKLQRVGAATAFAFGNDKTVEFFQQMFGMFRKGPKEVGKNVGGVIAIVGATRQAVSAGPADVAYLLGTLSLSLGFFNLLPIPVLDGGHLTLLTLEAVRRRKLTAEQTQRVLMAGFAVIAVLFVVITFKDITRLFLGRG